MHKSIKAYRNGFVDTTGPFPESLIGNRYWIGLVDEYINYS